MWFPRFLAFTVFLVFPGPTYAASSDYEEHGEVHVETNVEYAVAKIDGKLWEDVEYERGGKRLIVTDLVFSRLPVTIEVVARDNPEYGTETIRAERKNFKKKRKGRVYSWIYRTKVKFKVAKKTEPTPGTKPGKKKVPSKPKKDEADDL